MRFTGMRGNLCVALCCIAITASACSPVSPAGDAAPTPSSVAPDIRAEASVTTEPADTPQLVLPTVPSLSAAERWNAAITRLSQPPRNELTEHLNPPVYVAEPFRGEPAHLSGSPCSMDEYCVRARPSPVRFVSLATGSAHTCGLRATGRVDCWGARDIGNSWSLASSGFVRIDAHGGAICGQRADGRLSCWHREGGVSEPRPYEEGIYRGFAVSSWQVCALDLAGRAGCWPFFHWTEPITVGWEQALAAARFSVIDAGDVHVCGIRDNGGILCWGSNEAGQLDAPAGGPFVHLAAGAGHTCALDDGGTAVCWGDNHFGQSSPPADVRFVHLTAGELHTCGLLPDSTARCWGGDFDGQASPPAGIAFADIAAGALHTCGVTSSGEARCWGLDADGRLNPPPDDAVFASLATGPGVACGIRHDGLAQCWGAEQSPSQSILGNTRFAQIALGPSRHDVACGLLTDGRVACWPTHIGGTADAVIWHTPNDPGLTEIALTGHGACGLTTERRIRCWALGHDPSWADVLPPDGEHLALAAGRSLACALSLEGAVACWSNKSEMPPDAIEIAGLRQSRRPITKDRRLGIDDSVIIRPLAVGTGAHYGPEGNESTRWHGCVIRLTGFVRCAGANEFGQASPPLVNQFRSLVAGGRHTCGITVEGTTECWGANDAGQSAPPPGRVFVKLAADNDHTCGLQADGDVVCWGDRARSSPAQLVPFDVNLPRRHSGDVKQLDRLRIFDGTECSTQRFCTDEPLTRVALAVWLDRLLQHEARSAVPESAASIEFDDVPAEVWWAHSARRLADLEVVLPCDDAARLFCASDHVSRAELEQTLVRALEHHRRHDPGAASHAAVANARAAIGVDVMSSCVDHSFQACRQSTVTRGQAATALNRWRQHINELDPPEFASVSTEGGHGCGRRADGTVECWGADTNGEAYVATGDRVIDVYYDGYFWCGRSVSREPTCHGSDRYYNSHVHEALSIPSPTEIAFGSIYACGIEPDGAVTCVGGVISDGGPPYEETYPSMLLTEVDRHEYEYGHRALRTWLPWTGRFVSVAVGKLHRCALQFDGRAVCWGKNEFGEASPPSAERFSHLALGVSHSCGLRFNGSVTCWGYDADGRSSPPSIRLVTPAARIGPAVGILGPVRAQSMRLKALAATGAATCGLTVEGLVTCWGTSSSRRSSREAEDWWNAHPPTTAPPTDVAGQVFTSISASGGLACAQRLDGGARCWGSGSFRRSLGVGTRFVEVSAGDRSTCGRRIDGFVQCWDHWELGLALETAGSYSAVMTAGTYACGRIDDGSPSCWTLSPEHQVPVEAATGDFEQLSDSGSHACSLGSDGAVECWGRNDAGEARPPPGSRFAQISTGAVQLRAAAEVTYLAHTCGVRVDGAIECWGDSSYGQSAPPAGNDFVKVAASGVHACALRRNGDIECWGQELVRGGPLRATEQYADVVVGAGGGYDSTGDDGTIWHSKHVCGLRVDGNVNCWGDIYSSNKHYDRYEPDSRSRFTSISSGRSHVCGVRIDGAIECWGIPAFIAY